jgi:hypothetical protein
VAIWIRHSHSQLSPTCGETRESPSHSRPSPDLARSPGRLCRPEGLDRRPVTQPQVRPLALSRPLVTCTAIAAVRGKTGRFRAESTGRSSSTRLVQRRPAAQRTRLMQSRRIRGRNRLSRSPEGSLAKPAALFEVGTIASGETAGITGAAADLGQRAVARVPRADAPSRAASFRCGQRAGRRSGSPWQRDLIRGRRNGHDHRPAVRSPAPFGRKRPGPAGDLAPRRPRDCHRSSCRTPEARSDPRVRRRAC